MCVVTVSACVSKCQPILVCQPIVRVRQHQPFSDGLPPKHTRSLREKGAHHSAGICAFKSIYALIIDANDAIYSREQRGSGLRAVPQVMHGRARQSLMHGLCTSIAIENSLRLKISTPKKFAAKRCCKWGGIADSAAKILRT